MSDGTYRRVTTTPDTPRVRSQERFLEIAAQRMRWARQMEERPQPASYVEAQPPQERRRSRKRQLG